MPTTSMSLFKHHALVSSLSFTFHVWRSHLRRPETRPPTAKAVVRRDLISALHDSAHHLFPPFSVAKSSTGFQNVISSILKAAGPSDSAKSSVYTKSQLAYCIYDGRYKAYEPRTSVAPPIQLFHPTFGHFLDTISNVNFMPDDDMICKCTKYIKSASAIYPDEKTRMRELTPLLGKILDVDIRTIMNDDKTYADGRKRFLCAPFVPPPANPFTALYGAKAIFLGMVYFSIGDFFCFSHTDIGNYLGKTRTLVAN